MKILFVNACPRGNESRTLQLAQAFLESVRCAAPDTEVVTHELTRMGLLPFDAARLARRETVCDARNWDDPLVSAAVEFQAADAVVIAAPYWDLSFPSILKIWVENMYVRNLTFYYENDHPVGLCRGRESIYITTAGSPIGENDWGAMYMKAVLTTLGIPGFSSIRAEALDLETTDTEAVMAEASKRAVRAAQAFMQRIRM